MNSTKLLTLIFIAGHAMASSVPENYKHIMKFPGNCSGEFSISGGQGLIIDVENLNVLGVTLSVSANGQEKSAVILPKSSHRFQFSIFGNEPMSWKISTSTSSDACVIGMDIYSTWKEGDEPNR